MATVWDLIIQNSSLGVASDNTLFDHLNNQRTVLLAINDGFNVQVDDQELSVQVSQQNISVTVEI